MKIYRRENLDLSNILRWNTGREYSANGQSLAACLTDDGNVIMVDFTRGLYYAYSCPLTVSAIMAAYDNNAHISAHVSGSVADALAN